MALSYDQLVILENELTTDPLELNYSAMSDDDAATSLNTENRTVTKDTPVTAYSLIESLGATAGIALMQDLLDDKDKGAAEHLMMTWLETGGGQTNGVNVGSTVIRSVIDTLETGGTWSSAQVAAVKALADYTVSRAEELNLPTIYAGNVAEARAM